MTHQQMRELLRAAFLRVMGRSARISELQPLQGVASFESGYGLAWKPPGAGSKNLGAIQAGASWRRKTYHYTDTTPQLDGSSKPYVTRFRWYDTWEEAADDLVRAVYVWRERGTKVLPFAAAGDVRGFSAGLYDTRYYEGFGKDGPDPGDSPREERIANHHRSIVASIRAQALALDEPLPAELARQPPPAALLRRGASGPGVVKLQEALNRHGVSTTLKVDGDFGAKTHFAVVEFQRKRGLVADGIVGDRTWDALRLSTPPAPAAA